MVLVERAKNSLPVIREVYPYLHVRGAAAAIDFYKRVFGAEELFRLSEPDGRIGHAELKLGPVTLMIVDEYPDYGIRSPLAFGGTGSTLHLHVDDVDVLARRAVQAGATMVMEPADQGHGERQCRVRDPFGHEWLLGHETEEVPREEMQRRFTAWSEAADGTVEPRSEPPSRT
ncbi:MAG: VOC family protein [Gemmatimonadetes bacterium]|nr:VOC family protein [Gemmatimonadota bacterium]